MPWNTRHLSTVSFTDVQSDVGRLCEGLSEKALSGRRPTAPVGVPGRTRIRHAITPRGSPPGRYSSDEAPVTGDLQVRQE